MSALLEVKDLVVTVGPRKILNGLSLSIDAGSVHAIMGPNALAGRPGYEITGGSVLYRGEDLLALPAEERARAGLFLGFQYPVEIPGVNNVYLLKAAINAARKAKGLPEVDAFELL